MRWLFAEDLVHRNVRIIIPNAAPPAHSNALFTVAVPAYTSLASIAAARNGSIPNNSPRVARITEIVIFPFSSPTNRKRYLIGFSCFSFM
jgi:hypothetical protein